MRDCVRKMKVKMLQVWGSEPKMGNARKCWI